MKIEKGKLYYDTKTEQLFIAPNYGGTAREGITDKIAVQCQTKEDWDYVVSKGYELRGYVGDTFYPLYHGDSSRIEYYESYGYRFISIKAFKEFYPENEQVLDKVKNKVLFQDKIDYAVKSTKVVESMNNQELGIKESDNKLAYELDFEFIKQIAERMQTNKGKYEPYNWKKPTELEQLKQSLLRHVIELMNNNYSDDGREYGHIEAIACNAMMINYQLKNNK